MRNKISIPYDKQIIKIQNCLQNIILTGTNNNKLTHLQIALNEAFRDAHCDGVIYTKNTDKPFFGMCIMPVIQAKDVGPILMNQSNEIEKKYYLEFDSKIFEIGLDEREMTAVLLHELGHIVLSMDQYLEYIQNAVAIYQSENREVLNLEGLFRYKELLAFGITDALRKIGSVFTPASEEEKKADSYAVMLGYGEPLQSALNKIASNSISLNRMSNDKLSGKLLGLQWSLRMYKNLKMKRVPAIRTLERMKQLTGSELEKKLITRCMSSIDSDMAKVADTYYESTLLENKNQLSIFRKMKTRSMRGVEDDLYEYRLRIKSVDEQDEALLILREINTRLSIIDDYLSDENLNKYEREKWIKVKREYILLRQELSKKTTYDDKYYGLFIKTPVIKSRYEI